MTTELTKAAPNNHGPIYETDLYDFAGWLTTRPGVMAVGSSCEAGPMAEAVGEYIKTFPERFALTQRPAAQAEREEFEAWYVDHCPDLTCEPIGSRLFTLQWEAWQARASLPTQPAAQATPVQDVGASADYWGDLAQQKADADARRGVSMPVSYYTSSIVGALLATQQATPATPDDMKVYDGIAADYFAETKQATPEPVRLAGSVHEDNARILQNILDELRMIIGLKYGESIVAAVRALTATPDVPETDFGNMVTQQATPEPDTCRKRPRCGRADPCAWLEKQATQQAAGEPVGEVFGYMNAGYAHEMQQGRMPYAHVYKDKCVGAEVPLYFHPAPGVPEGWRMDREGDDAIVVQHPAVGIARAINPAMSMEGQVLFMLCDDILQDSQSLASAQAKGDQP